MAKLSLRQKKRISKLVVLTTDDYALIKLHKFDWDHKNLKLIRDRIRDHYHLEQDELCAFCKLPFRDDIQVEHIIPKDGKYGMAKYAFYPVNLVVACKHCNTRKSINNEMIPWNKIPYPRSGIFFRIIHPHYDDYFKNIEIVDKSMYVARSVKGLKTIERCKLYHPTILGVLSKSMRYEDDSLIQGVLRIREMQGDFKATIERFVNRLIPK